MESGMKVGIKEALRKGEITYFSKCFHRDVFAGGGNFRVYSSKELGRKHIYVYISYMKTRALRKLKIFTEVKWVVATLFIYIIFHKPIEHLLSQYVVTSLLSTVESTWVNDSVFFITAAFIISRIFTRSIFPISRLFWTLSVLICILYLYYRIMDNEFIMTDFSFAPWLKYADILLLFVGIGLYRSLKGSKSSEYKRDKQAFDDDSSIGCDGADLLGYMPYANNLAKKILCSDFGKSFAIGINGKWGLGKTSFVDLLKRSIGNRNEVISIDFNPWNSQTPQAIIKDFFNTIEERIREEDPEISNQLVNYANKLMAINDSRFSKTLQSSVSLLFGYDSLNSLHKTINDSLEKLGKKIVVYIDDIDRLDKNEIVEVIRLIRNTADFFNTCFIVCYDKQYITEALKDQNPYNHGQFLEKIFQIEITLPHFKKEVLRKVLSEKLKKFLPEGVHNEIDHALYGGALVAPAQILDWLDSIRDVTRLSNAILLNLTPLLGEVDVRDFINLELLHLKYPGVYQLLFRDRQTFFQVVIDQGGNIRKYGLIAAKDLRIHEGFSEKEKNEKYLKVFLSKNWEEMHLPQNEVDKVFTFIQDIFQDAVGYHYPKGRFMSVVNVDKFDRYFSYSLSDEDLSDIEFKESLTLEQSALKRKIDQWVTNGLGEQLQDRFKEIKQFRSLEEFEKVIRAIFYLANRPSGGNRYQHTIGYDGDRLIEMIGGYQNNSGVLYANAGGKDALGRFIKQVFEEADMPFYYESQFVRLANRTLVDGAIFPLTRDELKQISIGYLEKYYKEYQKIDQRLLDLFWDCEQTKFLSSGNGGYSDEKYYPDDICSIMREIINKELNEFIYLMIDAEPLNQETFAISGGVTIIFGSWEKFKEYINGEKDTKWSYLKEFKELFTALEATGFKKYINFKFYTIPIDNKLRRKQ